MSIRDAIRNDAILGRMKRDTDDADGNAIVDQAESAVPAAHDLGGAQHNADTLADLNAKISNATLDDSGDPRDPNAHTHGNADRHRERSARPYRHAPPAD